MPSIADTTDSVLGAGIYVPDAPIMSSIADTTDSILRAGIYVPDAPTMPSSKMPLLNKITSHG